MSKMFDYISGKAEGREAELEATLEHLMAHCVPEPEYDKMRSLVRRWVDMKLLPETSMLMLESRDALKQ